MMEGDLGTTSQFNITQLSLDNLYQSENNDYEQKPIILKL